MDSGGSGLGVPIFVSLNHVITYTIECGFLPQTLFKSLRSSGIAEPGPI